MGTTIRDGARQVRGVRETYFTSKKHDQKLPTKTAAGLAAFLAVASIVFIKPTVLSDAGMDRGAAFSPPMSLRPSHLAKASHASRSTAFAPMFGAVRF
jgi:xanthine/uracil/vitamin C permease (AzgA family)